MDYTQVSNVYVSSFFAQFVWDNYSGNAGVQLYTWLHFRHETESLKNKF